MPARKSSTTSKKSVTRSGTAAASGARTDGASAPLRLGTSFQPWSWVFGWVWSIVAHARKSSKDLKKLRLKLDPSERSRRNVELICAEWDKEMNLRPE